jgi:hypothetical protein
MEEEEIVLELVAHETAHRTISMRRAGGAPSRQGG